MDQFEEVGYRGFGSNLLNSVVGVLVGIIMFLASFWVLWWNEGRTDMSMVAKKAVVVDAAGKDSNGDGKLIAATSTLTTDEQIGDPDYLKTGPYLMLRREVEMYAWVEDKHTREEKQLGGGTKTITTYEYNLKWTARPKSSDDFRHPEGHRNPALAIPNQTFRAAGGHVGAFAFDPSEVELPPSKDLSLGDRVIGHPKHDDRYIFRGRGSLESPHLGDVRISFEAVESGSTVTLYGERHGQKISPYMYRGEDKLFRVVPGTHQQAIAYLHQEHTMITWVLRIVGFVLMWFGLTLFFGPINTMLDILPFLGSMGRFIIGVVMFPLALILSSVTITVSMVAHSPILLAIAVVVVATTCIVVLRRRKQKQS
jgi:hypothetical protein